MKFRNRQVTASPGFEIFVAGIILLNVLAMAVQTNYPNWGFTGAPADDDSPTNSVWFVINTMFLLFFTLELALRALTSGWKQLAFGVDWRWNAFDMLVVVLGWSSILASALGFAQRGGVFVTAFRTLRILRILRIAKLFRQLKKIRRLVEGLFESVGVVFWIASLLLCTILLMALLCTTAVGQNAWEWNDDMGQIQMYFGSVTNSSFTCFQLLTFDDWSNISRLVMRKKPWMVWSFLGFVTFAAMVVLSLLTGVMVDHMNAVRQQELAEEEDTRRERLATALGTFYKVFRMADLQTDNLIDRAEFGRLVANDQIQDDLRNVGVDLSSFKVDDLFTAFDTNGSGVITWHEFRNGMEDLRKGITPRLLFRIQAAVLRVAARQSKDQKDSKDQKEPGEARKAVYGAWLNTDGSYVQKKLHETNLNMGHLETRLLSLNTAVGSCVNTLVQMGAAK